MSLIKLKRGTCPRQIEKMSNIEIMSYLKTYGIGIIWILIVFFGARIFLHYVVKKIINSFFIEKNNQDSNIEQRVKTLWGLFSNIGNVAIYVIILLMILRLVGIDITPILGGIGVVGVALGFGAQSLVKDFISGIFMLLENQYNVGDEVEILCPKGSRGKVVKITIRSTIIKDSDGNINYIANGSITNVVNYSKKEIISHSPISIKRKHK